MDGERKTPARSAVAAREGRSILPLVSLRDVAIWWRLRTIVCLLFLDPTLCYFHLEFLAGVINNRQIVAI